MASAARTSSPFELRPSGTRPGRLRSAGLRVAAAAIVLLAADARAQSPTSAVPVDRTAARFYAPETGGTAYPRFVTERTLAFEARLVAMAQDASGAGDGYDERDVREALDHHVAEEMLSNLADRLIADSPPDARPSAADLADVERRFGDALTVRLGGRSRIEAAARAEQLDGMEVQAIVRRGALAAWYIDRAVTPILHPSDEELRSVLRASATPYRGRRFADVRDALEQWFIVERVRVTESAFLQGARSRVHIVMTP